MGTELKGGSTKMINLDYYLSHKPSGTKVLREKRMWLKEHCSDEGPST